ncbi:SusC/RagA family TonB-linked outer membrane protein [Paradesertivirga mongoliensis]|uniref:SusC/RagA family TonB-linked outer membrane protein n=1 Tax=Paradesertivirga mongoliensis TaxID=2100740 RepID=A0ABW4ZKZ3_9SPHI|nr:TonB-dependent receptor [Pedobacter mongoliensis]
MKQSLLVLLLLFGLHYTVQAQTKTVEGKVLDARTKVPIAGATIKLEGSRTTATSNERGDFRITAPADAKILVVTFVGYQEQISEITDQPLVIGMMTESKNLEEVVVVGYGTQRKKDVTGSVSSISAKDVGDRRTVQISEALQGTMSGVSVTRNSGAPGAGSNVLIRGITTIGTNAPLFIVDGIPNSNIDNVNPGDVENITVLKDAASASIYGSRGAAGVVLVTTKRAKAGQSSFDYNFEYGLQKPTALPEYTSSPDYMRYFNEQAMNDGATAGPFPNGWITGFADSLAKNLNRFPFFNTDWQKEVMTNSYAPRVRHDLVFTMGTDKVKTKASLGYNKSGAFYDNYDYERYLFRINNDLKISDKFNTKLDVTYKRTQTQNVSSVPDDNPIFLSRLMPSVYGAYYSDGRYSNGKDGLNPVAQINEGGFEKGWFNQFGARLAFNYTPVAGLTFTAMVAPTFDLDKFKNFRKQINYYDYANPSQRIGQNRARTFLDENRNENFTANGQLLANYTKSINELHNFDVLVGYEENYSTFESLGASREGFALNDFPYLNAGSSELRDNRGSASESALRSFFGRLQYNFKNRYYLQGNLRHDQSSRFASEFRNAIFPSFNAAWTISEEPFMENIPAISHLKLRGGWGTAGNERIGNYPYQAIISFSNSLFYQNGSVVPLTGGGQVEYAMNNISWETTSSTDLGVDATFLNNRLNLSAGYFHKKTEDILLRLDIPNYLGYDNPFQNAGTLQAKGWELDLGWRDKMGRDFNYSFSMNLSDTKTKVLNLKGTQFRGDQAILEGGEFNEWFGYRSNGLFQNQAEVTGAAVINANTKPGDVRYVDINKDGKITPEGDKVFLGGSMPRYNYGGTLRMDYKNLDFGMVVQGVGKKNSVLSQDITRPFQAAFGNMPLGMVGNFWSRNNTPEQNLAARYPRLSRTSEVNNYEMSDFYMISGAYFRVKNLTLGYTLKSKDLLAKAGIKALRVYATANDVAVFSKFPKYWDPEAGTSSYPIVTTFLGGVNLTF